MTTSTDASTVIGEAEPVGTVVSTDASPRNGAAAPLVEHAPTVAGPVTAGAGAPAVGATVRTEDPAAGAPPADDAPPSDDASPTDGCPAPDEPPESWLRIERGRAEPEEIAALSVVLCAQIAALRALAAPGEAGPPAPVPLHGRRRHPHRSACWSGCWTC
ncbi:acyl-CoA carboxylase subunit epsilon [Streptomyces sioyaensis]|uniref:acyl-CoA carboxylase subunit epsilon n=1 Tax=Streptomyces sioyaensis TaxID=67364 RepID=UPI003D754F7B